MQAIFRGTRHFIVGRADDGIWIERLTGDEPPRRRLVSGSDPDLIINPTDEDLDLAEAYERQERVRVPRRAYISAG